MVENISIPPQATAQPQIGITAAKTQVEKAEIKSERAVDVKDAPDTRLDKNPEQTRFEAVKEAAQAVTISAYPIRDTRFTIYQERAQSGGIIYVTRFTNLESGEVELVREPELMLRSGGGQGTLLTTSV